MFNIKIKLNFQNSIDLNIPSLGLHLAFWNLHHMTRVIDVQMY